MAGLKRGHGPLGLGAEEASDRQARAGGVEQLLGLHDLIATAARAHRGRYGRPACEVGEWRAERGQRLRLRAVEVEEAQPR